jgi:hypothetical protein
MWLALMNTCSNSFSETIIPYVTSKEKQMNIMYLIINPMILQNRIKIKSTL